MESLANKINVQVNSKNKKEATRELENALKEGNKIICEIKEGKREGYNNINDMLKSIIDD